MADAGIILAAGQGLRMGQTKQLLPWQGRPLLSHILATCLQTNLAPLVLVLGHQADQIQNALALSGPDLNRVTTIINPEFKTGMASSLKAGLGALNSLPGSPRGALFILGDQPLVSASTISAILDAAGQYQQQDQQQANRIIIPRQGGRQGNPVYFPAAFFNDLARLSGDRGGRVLFDRFPEQLSYLDFPSREIHADLDTPEDYRRLLADQGAPLP